MSDPTTKILEPKEAARILKTDKEGKAVRKMMREGRLGFVWVGNRRKTTLYDVQNFIQQNGLSHTVLTAE